MSLNWKNAARVARGALDHGNINKIDSGSAAILPDSNMDSNISRRIRGAISTEQEVTIMSEINKLAARLAAQFERRERHNGVEIYTRIDDCPDNERLQELCMVAHGDMFPDDYKYRFIVEALNAIGEAEDGDDLMEYIPEPDTYTSNLTEWLHSNNSRVGYMTEAMELWGGRLDGFQLLRFAQTMEIEEVFNLVIAELEKWVDDEEECQNDIR